MRTYEMTLDDDALRTYIKDTMTNSYWIDRNALVDAVRAAQNGAPSLEATGEHAYGVAFSLWCRSEAGKDYNAALDALTAFDARHGGAPIL